MAHTQAGDQASGDAAATGAPDDGRYASPAYRWYALALLTIVYMFNYVDRKIVVILQESIKAEFDLSDAQLGLLSGFAFVFFYVLLGVPIARWADRGNRRDIISIAIALWSVMTAVCGLAHSYAQLALARVGVGVGEAGASPPAHSMLSDIFPPERRAMAMGIYSTGVNLGILVGFLLGGWIDQLFGWRMAFVVVGLPGIAVALLVRFTLQEPRRGMGDGLTTVEEAPPVMMMFRLLWSRPAFRALSLAAAMSAFFANGMLSWMPSFLARSHNLSSGEIGSILALILGVVGGAGSFLGGMLADRLSKRDVRWNVWLSPILLAIAMPFVFLTLLTGDTAVAMLAYCIPVLISGAYIGPVLAMTHAMVSVRTRASASAILFLILNMLGLGLGPLVIGILSDALGPAYGKESLRYALIVTSVVSAALAAAAFLMAGRHLKNDLARPKGGL